MNFWLPGWPGPAMAGNRANIPNVALPAMPVVPGLPSNPSAPGGATAAAPASPLAGLAAYGVPIGQNANGQPVIRAGGAGQMMMPPEIPGMPTMPTPPPGFLGGGMQGGGLFQPMAPVAPFPQNAYAPQPQQQGMT